MKNKNIIALLAVVVLIIASYVATTINHSATQGFCIEVYVDYGSLDNGKVVTDCVEANGKIDAMTALNAAGFAIQGTDKYGLQVVCRVNGFPEGSSPIGIPGHEDYVETCKDMPAEFAYWAILVRSGSNPWGWAETGLADIKLENGDSIGLVFASDEQVDFPNE